MCLSSHRSWKSANQKARNWSVIVKIYIADGKGREIWSQAECDGIHWSVWWPSRYSNACKCRSSAPPGCCHGYWLPWRLIRFTYFAANRCRPQSSHFHHQLHKVEENIPGTFLLLLSFLSVWTVENRTRRDSWIPGIFLGNTGLFSETVKFFTEGHMNSHTPKSQ